MAEAILRELAREGDLLDQLIISSAGTQNWDVGLRPDYRAQQLLKEHNYPLDPRKRAQQITNQKIEDADYLVAMSRRVANELGSGENVYLLMDFVEGAEIKDIPDPYPTDTFVQAFDLIEKSVKAFYEHLRAIRSECKK